MFRLNGVQNSLAYISQFKSNMIHQASTTNKISYREIN